MISGNVVTSVIAAWVLLGISANASQLAPANISRLESNGLYSKVLTLCADDNSAKSLCIRGDYLYHGRKGIPADRVRGQELYKKALAKILPAAEAGDIDAQYWAARCLEYGVHDLKEARKWYVKSADAGNAKAMFKAAWFSVKRLGAVGASFDEAREAALRYAKAASEAGNADGTALMAWLAYIDCRGERNFEKALPEIRKSVEGNSPLGKMLLGRMYMEGTAVEQDMDKAERLLREAVDQGCSEAWDVLKEIRKKSAKDEGCVTTGKCESAEVSTAKMVLQEQAKKGAELYENPETREEGLAILRKSAKNGSPFALARLSALYYLGEGGVKKEYGTALRLMKSAAAKGFPSFLLPIAEAEAALKREKECKLTKKTIGLGDGYAGRLEPYKVTPELRKRLDEFGLTAGWFRRDAIPEGVLNPNEEKRLLCNELPYLLFTPTKCGQKPVPIIVYFAGTGEQGTDLTAHFHQTTIFAIVTSPEFQEKHPCYLFAPMVPKEAQIACLKEWSPPMADLVCDAMYAVIRGAKTPKVDINRLYLTGLSYGGRAAWTFPFGYPGRFAASIPVAGYANAETVPDSNPGSFWFVYNEGEYASEKARRGLADMARVVAERGGEFRMSPIPDKGHNAWDKAWREDAVWDWMFSKSNNGSKGSKRPAPSDRRMAGRRTPLDLTGAVCKAAKPGRDEGTNPSRAADGLDATCYVSAEPVVRGDWWQIEFAQPVGGRITVKSGFRNGSDRAQAAYVEVSADGRKWTTAGRFKRTDGECTFVPRGAVKFLRVVSDSKEGETLVLREVAVE